MIFRSSQLSLYKALNLSTSAKYTELERSSVTMSSEYFIIGVVSVLGQLFVCSVKRMGDRTVPCGGPVEIQQEEENAAR